MNDIDAVSVPGYRIVSRIMAGGMATVYIAEQLKLGSRRVAIKIFRNRNPDQALADHTKARHKRFAQEALIARNLQHPHIVQIFDYGSTDEFQFLTMEYLAHGDLKQRIREGLQPVQVLQILQQIGSALSLLHQSDIVHRDIKPANILFREPDHAVLADFGIARSIEQNTQLTHTGFVLGTPSYMSPEQINGGRITAKTDIYALGVLLYEMLTGHLPYRGDSVQSVATQHLMAPVPPLPLEVRKLQPLLNRLMAKKPEERIANGGELLQVLARIDNSRGFAVKPPTFLQIHARKIIAVAALMFCSVAITWAGISQLPYWLSDVAPLGQDVQRERSMLPTMQEAIVVPQILEPSSNVVEVAPQKEAALPNTDTPVNVSESVDVKQEAPQVLPVAEERARSVEKSVAQRIGEMPARRVEKKDDKNPKKNSKEKEPSTAASIKSAESTESLDHAAMPAVPTLQAVAEQRMAYDVDAVEASSVRQNETPLPGEMQADAAPHASSPEKKRKLPPVISYF